MKKLVVLSLSLLLGAALLFTGCGTESGDTEGQLNNEINQAEISETASEPVTDGEYEFEDEILVGRVFPETGVLSSFGEGTPYVEELAIDAINKKGGIVIDGKRCSLRMEYRDSKSTLGGADAAAKELIDAGIDIMITSHTADTVIPVSVVCEKEGIACISVDSPASAWIMGGPYANSWHSFFDNEREMLCFLEAWESIDTNRRIGIMTANDSEGVEISTFIHDFAAAKGYEVVDSGAYYIGEDDYSEYINAFAENECDIILGVMVNEDFARFWTQLNETDYMPKMCTVAKACLFEKDIKKLGNLGDGLITEVWWTDDFPYVSSIDGTTSKELGQDYLRYCNSEVNDAPVTVGYKYANVEILYDILTRSGSLELDKINEAARTTDLNTVIGHVAFNKDHISLMSCLTGQWNLQEDGSYKRKIVGNYLIPNVETDGEIKLLEKK